MHLYVAESGAILLTIITPMQIQSRVAPSVQTIANTEFGFSAKVQKRSHVCIARSGDHPHGYYFNIENGEDCSNNRDDKVNRTISIYAYYNTAEYKSDLELLDVTCKSGAKNKRPLSSLGSSINGKPASSCIQTLGSNGFNIIVVTQSCELQYDIVPPIARINYVLGLQTDQRHFKADLINFKQFISSVKICKKRP